LFTDALSSPFLQWPECHAECNLNEWLWNSAGGYMGCQICGANTNTVQASFSGNIGAVVIRFVRSISGYMCRSCLHEQYWKYTAMNFFLGWWGVISFFVTPINLVTNTYVYIDCLLSLRKQENLT
jgi:hypothetical protein